MLDLWVNEAGWEAFSIQEVLGDDGRSDDGEALRLLRGGGPRTCSICGTRSSWTPSSCSCNTPTTDQVHQRHHSSTQRAQQGTTSSACGSARSRGEQPSPLDHGPHHRRVREPCARVGGHHPGDQARQGASVGRRQRPIARAIRPHSSYVYPPHGGARQRHRIRQRARRAAVSGHKHLRHTVDGAPCIGLLAHDLVRDDLRNGI